MCREENRILYLDQAKQQETTSEKESDYVGNSENEQEYDGYT